jgi:HNH endonuclease
MAAPLSAALRARVRRAAADRCGYCRTSQAYVPWPLEINPIIPRARGGSDAEDNLWLACRACNLFKGQQTHARDPLTGRRHFQWSPDGIMILGRAATGRATVVALSLNNLVAVTVRRNWVTAGWHPPPD